MRIDTALRDDGSVLVIAGDPTGRILCYVLEANWIMAALATVQLARAPAV